jgi:hypothetical protein
MADLHPSKTAKSGHLPSDDFISRGVNRDVGAFPATKDVYCKQCGFPCNLARDIRKIDQFAGESIGQGFKITDHGYPTREEIDGGEIYEGSERTTVSLSAELSNGSFEDWTTGNPDSWTLSGSVTEETSSGYFDESDDGSSSCKITRSGSDISLSQTMANPSDFGNNTIIFRARVKSSTNEVIRLRVDVNSVSYYSSYNIAQQNFQELSCLVICPATVSSLIVYILADSANGTAYIDQCILHRSGNPITATVSAGCPQCGSFNYY